MSVMIVLTFCLAVPGLRMSTTTNHKVLGLQSEQDKQSSTVESLQKTVEKLGQDLSDLQALLQAARTKREHKVLKAHESSPRPRNSRRP